MRFSRVLIGLELDNYWRRGDTGESQPDGGRVSGNMALNGSSSPPSWCQRCIVTCNEQVIDLLVTRHGKRAGIAKREETKGQGLI